LVAVLLCGSVAAAAGGAGPVRFAMLPPRDAALGPAAARVEAALLEAGQSLPGFVVSNLVAGKLTAPRKADVHAEPGLSARALTLGKETGAQRAIAIEATPLGEGLVIYLQSVEVPSGRAIGSTTVSLSGGSARAAGDRDAMRSALMRVLDPGRYLGRLQLKLDVQGAEVQIDGRPARGNLIEVSVGTHALRVTHPAYHDFLRFLDVEFDKTVPVDVNMAAYPLAEGEMTEQQRRELGKLPKRRVPWYRTWWALTLAGVVITGGVTTAIWFSRPSLPKTDGTTPYQPMPTP
jgi:hypothetical protein